MRDLYLILLDGLRMPQVSFHRAEREFRIEIPCKNCSLKPAEDGLAIKCQCHSSTPSGKVKVSKVELYKPFSFYQKLTLEVTIAKILFPCFSQQNLKNQFQFSFSSFFFFLFL